MITSDSLEDTFKVDKLMMCISQIENFQSFRWYKRKNMESMLSWELLNFHILRNIPVPAITTSSGLLGRGALLNKEDKAEASKKLPRNFERKL